MRHTSATDLICLLSRNELRIRTGIIEVSPKDLGFEREIAVALGIGFCNLCEWRVGRMPSDRRTSDLSWERTVADLQEIITCKEIPGACVFVSGIDAFLAAAHFEHRKEFWNFMWGTFRSSRGLLLAIPTGASNLFPEVLRKTWAGHDRLYTLMALDEVFARTR